MPYRTLRNLSFHALLVVAGLSAGHLDVRSAAAVDHRVEPLKTAPPTDGVAKDVLAQLEATGVKVVAGKSRTLCEIWLCKQWPVKAGFKSSDELLYPFQPGQLLGLVRYASQGSDFRDHDVAQGVYTLRYGQQPVDGNHVGTSPTRDFLLLIRAKDDASAKPLEEKAMLKASADAAGAKHPALLCLRRVTEPAAALPAILHDEQHDLWSVQLRGATEAGGKPAAPLVIELVVVGHAAE